MVAMASSTPARMASRSAGLQRFVDAARDGKVGVNAAAAQGVDDLLAEFAQVDGFDGQRGVGLDQADHVADGRVGVEAEQQVGAGQFEEVHAVALDDLAHVHQFAQQGGRAGRRAARSRHRRLWPRPGDG